MNRKKTITELKKIFNEKKDDEVEDIPINERRGYLDPASVLMVVPKTTLGRDILVNNFEVGEPKKVPELDYCIKDSTVASSKYSIEYLKVILDFIKCFGVDEGSVRLSVGNDFPLSVELKHFLIILAPRVDGLD